MRFKLGKKCANVQLICFIIVLLMMPISTKPQSAVQLSEIQNVNQITLQCQLDNGVLVDNAKFYRNGLEYSSMNGSCLQTIAISPPSDGRMAITLTADCEGYFQCGHQPPQSGLAVLSVPVTIYAYPVPLTTESITIEVPLGDDIRLPCPFTVSALNSFSVSWLKNKNSAETLLDNPVNNDYSVLLPNVTFEDSAIYFCTVVSVPFGSSSIGRSNGPIITLKVVQTHVPPKFTSDLIFRRDVDLNYLFHIQAKGTDPLVFYWYIEDEMMTANNLVIQPTDHNQVLEKRSELQVNLKEIAEGKSSLNLTVFVTNTNINNDNEIFSVSLTSIILIFREDDYQQIDSIEKETHTNIILYVLGFVLLLSWILIFLLVIAIAYYKLQLKLLKKRGLQYIAGNESQIPIHHGDCQSVGSSSVDCVISDTEANSNIQPLQEDPKNWCNPISYILYQVAFRYRNKSPSDRSLIQSFHQVLIEVLNTQHVTNDREVVNWVIGMRDRVREFGDKLLKEEWAKRRQMSQEFAARQAKVHATNDGASIPTDSQETEFTDGGIDQVETEEMSLQAAKETGCVRDMAHIQTLFDEWITRHQQNPANSS